MRSPHYHLLLSLTVLVGCTAPPVPTGGPASGNVPSQARQLLLPSGVKPADTSNLLLPSGVKPADASNLLLPSGAQPIGRNAVPPPSGAQAGLATTTVKGQILLNSGILINSGILLNSGVAPSSGILLNSGFQLQQAPTQVPGAGFVVTATDANGKTYGPVTTNAQGQYALPNTLAQIRLQLQAQSPTNPNLQLQAMVDTNQAQDTPADINTNSTAQALLLQAQAARTGQPVTQVPLSSVQQPEVVKQVEETLVQVLTTQPLTQPILNLQAIQTVVQQAAARLPVLQPTPSPTPNVVLPVNPVGTQVPGVGVGLVRPSGGSLTLGSPLQLEAVSASLAVFQMDFYDGFEKIGTINREPYRMTWQTTGKATGKHALKAVARDNKGDRLGESPVVEVELLGTTSSSGLSPVPAPTPAPAAPAIAVPTGLASSDIASTSFTLTWGAVAGATSYKVYRDGILVANPTGTTQNVTGLTANTTYAMTVSAVNAGGESAQSAGLNVTPNRMVSTVAGSGVSGFSDGAASAARFNLPIGLTLDTAGNIFVMDRVNRRVRKIGSDGNVSTVAGSGVSGFSDGAASAARFDLPVDVEKDSAGNLYVTDGNNSRIRKIDTAGNVSTYAGSSFGGQSDGIGTVAQFNSPAGLAINSSGNLFISDINNQNIRKIGSGVNVTTVAGSIIGTGGFSNGLASAALFNTPNDLVVDSTGNIYLADQTNHSIRKIDTIGNVTTIAGSTTSGYSDGVASAALFNQPAGIAMDSVGNIFVGDSLNHCIRKIDTAGSVSTYAGTNVSGYSDGISSQTKFRSPRYLKFDSMGNLFVVDQQNHSIRKITP